MRNGVIVIPPHDFKQICRWYNCVLKDKNYEFLFVTYGIISMQNLINFRPAII
jgi:hypothetical protein